MVFRVVVEVKTQTRVVVVKVITQTRVIVITQTRVKVITQTRAQTKRLDLDEGGSGPDDVLVERRGGVVVKVLDVFFRGHEVLVQRQRRNDYERERCTQT